MSKPLRVGVYIPRDIAVELEELMKSLGVDKISKVIQEALRLYIVEHKWRTSGSVAGAIGVVYNHDVPHVDELLTDVQHKYLDIIVSTLHIHLDRENCMLIVVVKGASEKIKQLVEEIEHIRGVKIVRPLLLSS